MTEHKNMHRRNRFAISGEENLMTLMLWNRSLLLMIRVCDPWIIRIYTIMVATNAYNIYTTLAQRIRTHYKRIVWGLAGWQIYGWNAILTNKEKIIQAAKFTPPPPPPQKKSYLLDNFIFGG
jgi:hypothetical protein